MRPHLLVLLAVVASLVLAPAFGQDPLAAAKDLYASAEYEKALDALGEARKAPGLEPAAVLAIEQYRALCLLAMGRKAEAEQAIEAVLDLDPFYLPGEDEAAPWVRAAFSEVRQRVLPATLQQLYGRGKRAFDRKAYAEAEADFRRVMRVLDDEDLELDEGARSDMRLVVQAFLDLAEATRPPPPAPVPGLATPSAEPPATPPAESGPPTKAERAVPPAGTQATSPGPGGPIYDSTASDVVPPLPLRQSVVIPEIVRPLSETEGIVEVVIGSTGAIESASVLQSFGSLLDPAVLQSVQSWRYRPATRAGSPVRYRRVVRIVLPAR
ncbi:MAG TPA: energy transducer TonB [Vicinamibacterales bacterium]|nr:energy transducer TonB [Vicinamibacterales bacterium]